MKNKKARSGLNNGLSYESLRRDYHLNNGVADGT